MSELRVMMWPETCSWSETCQLIYATLRFNTHMHCNFRAPSLWFTAQTGCMPLQPLISGSWWQPGGGTHRWADLDTGSTGTALLGLGVFLAVLLVALAAKNCATKPSLFQSVKSVWVHHRTVCTKMMSWFGGMSRSNSDRPSSASPAAQKLGGYHELAKV